MFGLLAAAHEVLHLGAAVLCITSAVVAWFRLPVLGKYIGAGLLAMAAGIVAYDMGFRERGALDQSAALRAEIAARDAVIAEKDRQAQAVHKIAEAASGRAEVAEKAAADRQTEVDRYAEELAKRPASNRCSLSDDDVRWLRTVPRRRPDPPRPPTRPF